AAVQEQHGWPASRAPVQIVEAHAAQDDVVRLGQVQVRELEPGGGRRQLQLLGELLGSQAHAETSWSTWFAAGYGALSAYWTPVSISVFTSAVMRSKTARSASPCAVSRSARVCSGSWWLIHSRSSSRVRYSRFTSPTWWPQYTEGLRCREAGRAPP